MNVARNEAIENNPILTRLLNIQDQMLIQTFFCRNYDQLVFISLEQEQVCLQCH